MATWYYYNENGEKIGPVRGRDVKQLVCQGTITPQTILEDDTGRTIVAEKAGLVFIEASPFTVPSPFVITPTVSDNPFVISPPVSQMIPQEAPASADEESKGSWGSCLVAIVGIVVILAVGGTILSDIFYPGFIKQIVSIGKWDDDNRKIDATFELTGHTDVVDFAAFSPDGKIIATASRDHTVRIWDTNSGKEMKKLEGHTGIIYSAIFSPNGEKIVTASTDGTARIWDTESGRMIQTLNGHREAWREDAVTSATFSPYGKIIVTATNAIAVRYGIDNLALIQIWDVDSGRELQKQEVHTDVIRSVTFSPNEKKFVTASDDGTARIWDVGSGRVVQTLTEHTGSVMSATFSPDGKKIGTASYDRTVRIWDAESGKELLILEHPGRLDSAVFSPDGEKIVAKGSGDLSNNTIVHTAVRVWNTNTGRELYDLEGYEGSLVPAIFSPDGKKILTVSGKTVRIWDANSGKGLQKFDGHTNGVCSAAFSPDGKTVVTTSYDRTARIWTLL